MAKHNFCDIFKYVFIVHRYVVYVYQDAGKVANERIYIGENINSLLFVVHFIMDFMCS
jgi:hypothetical protein